MNEIATKDLAARTVLLLTGHGDQVPIGISLFGGAAYHAALAASLARWPPSAPTTSAPHAPCPRHTRCPITAPPPPTPGVPVTRPTGRTPAPITADRKPRLVTALFRRYLRAVTADRHTQTNLLAGGHPEAALDEARRRDVSLHVDSYRVQHPN
ncbi:hypothetical protein OH768_47715 [Streptomyces sp. NBC_01622]|uniref:hypothetical protein n=1 Tax=Streptomyces sp. NBC_01622 TaxID=2975903 RepID=UPI0038696515|nr:hypothetical protein OH768_47715 [Streptomyces sp. NBC_01622]